MKLLGVDYGLKRIGLAISDGQMASALGKTGNLAGVVQIAQDQAVDKIIVGLPDPENSTIKYFGARLSELTNVPLEFWDETLSTKEAQKSMIASGLGTKARRLKIDQNAAAVILQSYLDDKNPRLPL